MIALPFPQDHPLPLRAALLQPRVHPLEGFRAYPVPFGQIPHGFIGLAEAQQNAGLLRIGRALRDLRNKRLWRKLHVAAVQMEDVFHLHAVAGNGDGVDVCGGCCTWQPSEL